VVCRRQLLELGFSSKAIRHRLATGRMHAVARGIYSVGRPQLSREGRWTAAILACGEGAVLSHRSAAAHYGIGEERPGAVEVSVRRRCTHRRAGIRVRSRPSLPIDDVGTAAGIPITSPVRTMLDLATELSPGALERTVNEADKHDVVDPESLRAALESRAGEPGVRVLRALLDRHTFLLSDTDLELLFRPIAAAAGLPQPQVKHWVNGFEVDFYWHHLGLVVETDGWRYHRTPAAQSRDALRDQTHTASGLTTLRFSHWQVKYDPNHVRAVLAATAAHRRAAPKAMPPRS
jgi:hypothetical protein